MLRSLLTGLLLSALGMQPSAWGSPVQGQRNQPPSDSVGRTPSSPGSANSPELKGEQSPPTSSAPPEDGSPRQGRRERVLESQSPAGLGGWWVWWERNHLAFLRPIDVEQALRSLPVHLRDPQWRTSSRELLRSEVVEVCRNSLRSSVAALRGAAVLTLSRMEEIEPEDLLAALADPDRRVRDQALLAASLLRGEARYYLMQMITGDAAADRWTGNRDDPRRVRAVAALFLAQEDPQSILKLVREFVADASVAPRFQALAVQALGRCVDPQAETLLVEIAEDRARSAMVRCAAIESLADLSRGEVLPRLFALLESKTTAADVRLTLSFALGRMIQPDRREELREMQKLADKDSSQLVRRAAGISLGLAGGTANEWYLTRKLGKLRGEERCWSALALGLAARRSTQDDAVLALIDALEKTHSVEESTALAAALGLAGNLRALNLLSSVARSAPSPRTRKVALQSIALLGNSGVVPKLIEMLDAETDPEVFAEAARTLGRLHPTATGTLHRWFASPRHAGVEERCALLEGMGLSRDPPAVSLMVEWLGRESASSRERAAAITALGRAYDEDKSELVAPLGFHRSGVRESSELTALLQLAD